MYPKVEVESVRRKNPVRHFVSRTFASCGFAFYDMYLGQVDLDTPTPPPGLGIEVFTRVAENQDIQAVASRRGHWAATRIARNQNLGSTCFIAEREDTIVGYAWVNETIFEFLGYSLRKLPYGTLCIHDVFVFSDYRSKKVSQQLLAGVLRFCGTADLHTAVCVVDRANAAAVAAFQHVGAKFRRAPILKLPILTPILLFT